MEISMRLDMSALRKGAKLGGADFSRSNKKLLWMLEALVKCNTLFLESNPNSTPIYKSGVRYRQEKDTEAWLDIPHIIEARFGDCEDLASWRVAELRSQGVPAKAYLRWYSRPSDSITLYHVLVRLPDGDLEDPSKILGMKGRA